MRIISLIVAVVGLVSLCSAQEIEKIHVNVSQTLEEMSSLNWTVRQKALLEMPDLGELTKQDPAEADRLRLGLIHLLITENEEKHANTRVGTWPGERSEYYASLIETVSDLNDVRAVPALLGAITTGGMATRGLARFGDQIVDPVLQLLSSPDPRTRASALSAIRNLFRLRQPVSANSYARIEVALSMALKDPEGSVRSAAISAIEFLTTRDKFVPALRQLSANDPATMQTGHGLFYTVRHDASELLDNIAHHVPPAYAQGTQ